MSVEREQFSSRMGFILAAAGAAVGLGNIWAFPTQAASNGGGAFVFVYLLMILIVAFPMLVVELAIGRHGRANPIDSMKALSDNPILQRAGAGVGFLGLLVPCLVLSFYAIVGGWLVCFLLAAMCQIIGAPDTASWLMGFSAERNVFGAVIFYVLTLLIVQAGVKAGIEKWSRRLMPTLLIMFVAMFCYVMTLEGATEGLKHFLVPDFSKIMDKDLILDAMGQGFFSLTIGGCSMLIYGSYLSNKENLPRIALKVAFVDTLVAVIAGLVILPAMYAAMANGVEIFDQAGQLKSAFTLVFDVLPNLFGSLGDVGPYVAVLFFLLMTVAALTSSISMLECPVALVSEKASVNRKRASWLLAGVIAAASIIIIYHFDRLFGLVAMVSTQYIQPFTALLFCLFGGWVWSRSRKLKQIGDGIDGFEQSVFWKVWPTYVKFVCPLLVFTVLWISV
ncbi:sodium-dependent transporter [Veronia nyctiphanis]|uniref:Sodium-dependent transporter n=1 Tax=Veronia nyctiphanis TaxID=1278244 RepID=A0A4Q0YNH5_9GAMM|nr:sodium-dependent transporter [Veronia nyctiphanis]RXJ72497.1 sodium-dependent transporter [Veronia nyctiphanis]